MDKRTTGIVATVVTVVLCACPGFFALCFGLTTAIASQTPGAEIDIFGSNDPQTALGLGVVLLCLGVIAIIVPLVVAYFTLIRNRNRVVAPTDVYTPPPSI